MSTNHDQPRPRRRGGRRAQRTTHAAERHAAARATASTFATIAAAALRAQAIQEPPRVDRTP